MKRRENLVWKLLFGLAFCFLCMGMKKEDVSADVIYLPDDMFAKEHKVEEYPNGRAYEVDTEEKENCYEQPESENITGIVASGDVVEVYYMYKNEEGKEWACIGEKKWLAASNLRLQHYDDIEFRKDHAGQIKEYAGELEGYCLTYPLKIYEYPGAEHVYEVFKEEKFEPWENMSCRDVMTPQEVYAAEDGTVWGYVDFYNMGYHEGWYCISQLPSGVVQDYDDDFRLTVQDCFIVLKKALKVPQEEAVESRFVVDAVTLQDVQRMLRMVLRIG